MAVVRAESELPRRQGNGWQELTCCDQDLFGVAVPMRAVRYVVEADRTCEGIRVDADEAMLYVSNGSGVLRVDGEEHALEPESMAWLPGGGELTVRAGGSGLEVLVASVRA